jgi:hypothetical protein
LVTFNDYGDIKRDFRVGNANLNVKTPQVADIKASKDGTNGSYVDGPLTIGYNVAPYISWTTS